MPKYLIGAEEEIRDATKDVCNSKEYKEYLKTFDIDDSIKTYLEENFVDKYLNNNWDLSGSNIKIDDLYKIFD